MNKKYMTKKRLPDSPGVYFFLSKNRKPIYIGKATSLKDRVRSYFSKDLITTRGQLLVKMVSEAESIDFKKTESVLEALLLEADLIKKFKPIYNTQEKDDKSFNCVVFTKEDFPRILVVRKKEIDFSNLTADSLNLPTGKAGLKAIFGPYPNSGQLKEALKTIRKIFPYRDEKCLMKGKPCFNYSIGLCPGVCANAVSKKEYAKTIKYLIAIFSGRVTKLISMLKKDMKAYADRKEFEKAGEIKRKIYALQHINDISLIKSDPLTTAHYPQSTFRIESYDIAHMSGQNMVGVMTVVTDGVPDKSEYKKFNIKTIGGADDTGALREVLERRLNHSEWRLPDLIVVDGGVAQLNAAKAVLKARNFDTPVVSVVKGDNHKMRDILGDSNSITSRRKEIILANSESHRFAIAFHKKRRAKSFLY